MRRNKHLAILLAIILLLQPVSVLALNYAGSTSYASGKYYAALTAVTLTGNPRTDIVKIARSQIGYQEGSNASQLSGEIRGDGNYTEYGRWYGLQDMWCAMFVSWCADTAGIPSTVVPCHSFTVEGLNKFIAWGRAYTRAQVANGSYTPQPGDIIYYKSSRNTNKTNHVGIVTSYSGRTIYTVEGNTSSATISTNGGAVCSKSYDISNTYIVYICSPDYASASVIPDDSQPFGVYFTACASGFESLSDALVSVGADGSFANRKRIAAANGIADYSGTAEQNIQLLSLLKAGTLLNPDGTAEPDERFFPACADSFNTLAAALESVGADASYAYRKEIAAANQITGYSGTIDQNTQMLSLLKAGKLLRPEPAQTPTVNYFPACDASFVSIAEALESIGADSSLSYRTKIAAANGIENYTGTAAQNTEMLNLLKSGLLIVPQAATDIGACTCGAEYLEHIHVAETCTENGAEYDRCTKCGTVSNRTVIPASGHTYRHEITQPTCTAPGTVQYNCSCGDTYSEPIPALGHDFDDSILENVVLVPPTARTAGQKAVRCKWCSVEQITTIPIPPRTPGDVNGDGQLNLLDAAILRRYLAGWNVSVNLFNADVDGDDTTTLADTALLCRYIVGGWNAVLL